MDFKMRQKNLTFLGVRHKKVRRSAGRFVQGGREKEKPLRQISFAFIIFWDLSLAF